MRFTGTSSVSGSYIIRGYLQPSTIGAIGFLAALIFFIRRKYALSGLVLGLGGLLHSNYLGPREWFLVPLPVIAEVVDRINDGTIEKYRYDAETATLQPR